MIVVTGATGGIGRRLVDQLLAEGAPVRALTRNPANAGLPIAAQTVRADFTAGQPLEPLLEGAEALYLNLAATGEQGTQALIRAAGNAGVRRIVFNSAMAVTGLAGRPSLIGQLHVPVEEAIRATGLEWCFIRGGMYATNSLNWAPAIRATGTVHAPYGQAVVAPVHEADVADVTARALLDRDGTHNGTVHTLTGTQPLTVAQQVEQIGQAIGRELSFVEVGEEDALEAQVAHGVPRPLAAELLRFLAASVGAVPEMTDTIEQVTGRPARSYADWARDHAADFR
ncbi:NAD-dependent epimerase/dehydratase family protein [Kitasatospora acidiphila]|uniref:NAD-dependent epimerase/dehydratase family protein n=1 Tax=Kitasatospora acidiphila TaxID=2567942 RepID=A0A540WDN9_9ACTN|nr:NAD(P)H-binding protein [Kitasatospora acidiphila]TQF07007.1 NAD-dependent epimerase/dehydratase family protein [Kitasatospora acidiphila]